MEKTYECDQVRLDCIVKLQLLDENRKYIKLFLIFIMKQKLIQIKNIYYLVLELDE